MIRFIKLDAEDTGYEFAWWNTVVDRFYKINGSQAWDSWADFKADYQAEFPKAKKHEVALLDRFEALCPKEYK